MTGIFSGIDLSKKNNEREILKKRKEIEFLLDENNIRYFNYHELSDPNQIKEKITFLLDGLKINTKVNLNKKVRKFNNLEKKKVSKSSINEKYSLIKENIVSLKNIDRRGGSCIEAFNTQSKQNLYLKGKTKTVIKQEKEKESNDYSKIIIRPLINENEMSFKTTESNNIVKTVISTQNECLNTENNSYKTKTRNYLNNRIKTTENNYSNNTTRISTKNMVLGSNIYKTKSVFLTSNNNKSIIKQQKNIYSHGKLKFKLDKLKSEFNSIKPVNLDDDIQKKTRNYLGFFSRNKNKLEILPFRDRSFSINRIPLSKEPRTRIQSINLTFNIINKQCNKNLRNCKFLYLDTKKAVSGLNNNMEESYNYIMNYKDIDKELRQESAKEYKTREVDYNLLLPNNSYHRRAKSSLLNSKKTKN